MAGLARTGMKRAWPGRSRPWTIASSSWITLQQPRGHVGSCAGSYLSEAFEQEISSLPTSRKRSISAALTPQPASVVLVALWVRAALVSGRAKSPAPSLLGELQELVKNRDLGRRVSGCPV